VSFEAFHFQGIYYPSAGSAEVIDRRVEQTDGLGVGGRSLIGLAQDADGGTAEGIPFEALAVVQGWPGDRDRVSRLRSDDHVEDARRIFALAGHRTSDIGEYAQRKLPERLVKPIVGRKPTSAWCEEGPRIKLPVSVPKPTNPELAATATAVPPLDPALTRSRAYGFLV